MEDLETNLELLDDGNKFYFVKMLASVILLVKNYDDVFLKSLKSFVRVSDEPGNQVTLRSLNNKRKSRVTGTTENDKRSPNDFTSKSARAKTLGLDRIQNKRLLIRPASDHDMKSRPQRVSLDHIQPQPKLLNVLTRYQDTTYQDAIHLRYRIKQHNMSNVYQLFLTNFHEKAIKADLVGTEIAFMKCQVYLSKQNVLATTCSSEVEIGDQVGFSSCKDDEVVYNDQQSDSLEDQVVTDEVHETRCLIPSAVATSSHDRDPNKFKDSGPLMFVFNGARDDKRQDHNSKKAISEKSDPEQCTNSDAPDSRHACLSEESDDLSLELLTINVPGRSDAELPTINVPGGSDAELPTINVPGGSDAELPTINVPGGSDPKLPINVPEMSDPELPIPEESDSDPKLPINVPGRSDPELPVPEESDSDPKLPIDVLGRSDPELPVPEESDSDPKLPINVPERSDPELPVPEESDSDPKLPINVPERSDPELPVPEESDSNPKLPIDVLGRSDPELPVPEESDSDPKLPINVPERSDPELPVPEESDSDPKLPINVPERSDPELPVPEESDSDPKLPINVPGRSDPELPVPEESDSDPKLPINVSEQSYAELRAPTNVNPEESNPDLPTSDVPEPSITSVQCNNALEQDNVLPTHHQHSDEEEESNLEQTDVSMLEEVYMFVKQIVHAFLELINFFPEKQLNEIQLSESDKNNINFESLIGKMIIKKKCLIDELHHDEIFENLIIELLQIESTASTADYKEIPRSVAENVLRRLSAKDDDNGEVSSTEKISDEKTSKIPDHMIDGLVVTFKSILQSVQEQYEAMYYEEMKLMLSKHSHLAETPYDSAIVLFGEGLAGFMLKEYEESFEKFREAEVILQEYARSDSSSSNDLALCLMYMGDAESSQGHYKSAPEYFERAIASHQYHGRLSRFEEIFKLERTTLSAMLSKHALSLRNDDRVVHSEKRYKQAMSCSDTIPSDIIVARTGLGNLLHSLGSNEKAVPEYLAAIDIAEREKDHLSLAWAHGNLGNTYLSLGKREKGLSHLQTSLELTLEYDFDPSSISRALNNLGTAYQSLNELDKAELYFDQALSQAIYANDVVGQARAYGNIGNVYMLLKDFLKAIPHYTEVLRLSRDRSTVYVAYHNRGCALFELAEKKKGEQYQFTKRGEFQFIAIGPDTGDMDYKHQQDEELDDHTTELYQQSLKDLRRVIKNVESAFSNSSSSTIGLDLYLSLFHINAKTFQRAQDCAFNLRDHYLSLTIAEQVRARTLGELLLKRKLHQLPTTFSTPLNIDSIKLAVESLPDPYTPVVVLSYTGTRLLVWVLVFDGKTVSINSFEQEPDEELFGKQLDMYLRYELADDLTGNIDLYGKEEEKEIEIEEPEEKRKEEKEIESDKDDEEKKQESDEEVKKEFAGRVDSSNMDTESLEKATEPINKEKGNKKSGPAGKRKILSDLYKMIAKPLEAILKAVIPEPILHSKGPHKLILIPDNSTKMIPFNALLNEEGGVYFGDKHTLQFFPSLLCLGVMSQAPPTVIHINGNTTGDVLIVGDPSTPPFKFEGEDWTPGPLPHAKKEAEWVGHYMGTPPLLGGEPTKDVVLSKLNQAKLIHLATHGSATHGFVLLAGHCYDRQTTLTSSLRYHEDESKLLLYASEIESLRLQSCLVILSSCDSGRGKFKGDEIQGMSRSFLLAGAAAVMTSLWKVPDQSASYFMQYFYCYLLDGHTSSVSLQKSIQSIRSIHHFSQIIHWGGYQLTGSDVRIVVEVSDQDRMVFKALGCPGGACPFPRLELLKQLENNLLSSTENNVQIIYGPCGTDPAETVKDFIAKHHSAYHSVHWCNASHSAVMNDVIKMMEKVVGDHQLMLLVIDNATVNNVADLIPLSCRKNIQIVLVAQSNMDYKEMVREVDIELKRGVTALPAVKPLTELECAQRIVYSLVSNEENDINHYNCKDIDSLASSCSGSPSVVKMAELVAAVNISALKKDPEEDTCASVLDVELKSCHEVITKLSQNKPLHQNKKEYASSLQVSSVIDSLSLSPVNRALLNCLSIFHGVPIPKSFVISLENEIMQTSSSTDSPQTSDYFSSSSSASSFFLSSPSSSCLTTGLSCVAELFKCHCVVPYPNPIILQSSAKVNSSIDMTLYTVPDIISEYMWSNMDTVDKLFAMGIAYKTMKKKALNLSVYSSVLASQLFERFEDSFSDADFDNEKVNECYMNLLALKELFSAN